MARHRGPVLVDTNVIQERFGAVSADAIKWLNATADSLEVTATALKWRLVALERLDQARAHDPDAERAPFRPARRGRH